MAPLPMDLLDSNPIRGYPSHRLCNSTVAAVANPPILDVFPRGICAPEELCPTTNRDTDPCGDDVDPAVRPPEQRRRPRGCTSHRGKCWQAKR